MPSAVIAAYHYEASTETLIVHYHSGKIYHYLGVPEKAFSEMRAAMAKGIWFNRHIKGKYKFKEVTRGLNQTDLFSQDQA